MFVEDKPGDSPGDQKKLSDEERDYIIGGQESQHQTNNAKKMSPWQILRNRQFWGIALPRFLAEPAWGTFNAWIPLFMFKVYGFNLKEIAMFAWMPMLFADLISIFAPGRWRQYSICYTTFTRFPPLADMKKPPEKAA